MKRRKGKSNFQVECENFMDALGQLSLEEKDVAQICDELGVEKWVAEMFLREAERD